jgi:diguanylate cyclase (GGDEF)-like protein
MTAGSVATNDRNGRPVPEIVALIRLKLHSRPLSDLAFAVLLVTSAYGSSFFSLGDGLFTPMYLPAAFMLWWFIERGWSGLPVALAARVVSDRLLYPESWNRVFLTLAVGLVIVVSYAVGAQAVSARAERYERVHEVGWFMAVGCVLTPALAALGVGVVTILGGESLSVALAGSRSIFVGDAIACAIGTPLLLRLTGRWTPDERSIRPFDEPSSTRLSAVVQAVSILLVPLIAFGSQAGLDSQGARTVRGWLVLSILPCLWIGLRGSSLVAQFASFFTVLVLSIVARQLLGQSQELVQIGAIMLAASFATLYSVAVVRAQRRRILDARVRSDDLLRRDRTDSVTGLSNRLGLVETMSNSANWASSTSHVAVATIEIDRFAELTDSIGYEQSERLLREVGERLSKSDLHSAVAVGRMEHGHFGVVATITDAQHAHDLGTELVRQLNQSPFLAGPEGLRVSLTASAGVASGKRVASETAELLRNADIALRRATQTGAGNVASFDPAWRVEAEQRSKVLAGLREAIDGDHGQLFLMYQSIESLQTGALSAAEALVRWRRSDGEVITPNDFISIAERGGLIRELGDLVFRLAVDQVAHWAPKLITRPDFVMQVNVSPAQLADQFLAQKLAKHCADRGVPTSRFCLELTETDLSTDPVQAMTVLRNLRDAGFRVALDDFGTGFSTISWLSRFPIDTLKIDRTFVSGLPDKPDDVAIVKLVIQLAAELNLSVTAEGIETESQRNTLQQLGCGTGQGYLFSRPISAEEFERKFT